MAHAGGAGKGPGNGVPVAVDGRVLARLFRDPKLHLLLAYPRMLVATLRDEGHDVGVAPRPYAVDLGISCDLWPADGSAPAWLPAFLDPETPTVLRPIIAHLLAARPEATPCWNVSEPTPREQRARAAALLRVAARANDAERDGSPTETAWWSATWRPPATAHEGEDVYPWFLRTLRRELREGPARSPVVPLLAAQDAAPPAEAVVPRQRLPKMPASRRASNRHRGRRR